MDNLHTQQSPHGAPTGSPGDAKCVVEILGGTKIGKLGEGTQCTFLFQGKISALNCKIFPAVIPRTLVKKGRDIRERDGGGKETGGCVMAFEGGGGCPPPRRTATDNSHLRMADACFSTLAADANGKTSGEWCHKAMKYASCGQLICAI